MLLKNTAGQGVYLYAYNTTTNLPATGIAATITGSYGLDGAAPVAGFATANPTEDAGGVYWQPLAQAETNANALAYTWSSTTAGVQIDPAIINTTGLSLPAAAPNASGGLLTVGTGAGQLTPDGAGHVVLAVTPPTAAAIATAAAAAILVTPANLLATDATGRVTVGTNADKTGYSLTTAPPTAAAIATAAAAAILVTPANLLATATGGVVTVGTNDDKTGYALSSTGLDLVICEPAAGSVAAINARQALAFLVDTGCLGIYTGMQGTTVTVSNPGGTVTRFTETFDSNTNRTAVSILNMP